MIFDVLYFSKNDIQYVKHPATISICDIVYTAIPILISCSAFPIFVIIAPNNILCITECHVVIPSNAYPLNSSYAS